MQLEHGQNQIIMEYVLHMCEYFTAHIISPFPFLISWFVPNFNQIIKYWSPTRVDFLLKEIVKCCSFQASIRSEIFAQIIWLPPHSHKSDGT